MQSNYSQYYQGGAPHQSFLSSPEYPNFDGGGVRNDNRGGTYPHQRQQRQYHYTPGPVSPPPEPPMNYAMPSENPYFNLYRQFPQARRRKPQRYPYTSQYPPYAGGAMPQPQIPYGGAGTPYGDDGIDLNRTPYRPSYGTRSNTPARPTY